MAPGFQEFHAPQVVVNVGEETVVNLRLAKVSEKQESIVVTEAVPLVDTSDARCRKWSTANLCRNSR